MGKILYLGLDIPIELKDINVTHCPLIRIVPRSSEHRDIVEAFANLYSYTHLIFTSKTAVKIFFDYAEKRGFSLGILSQKKFLSVGQKTTLLLKKCGIGGEQVLTADEDDETAEGVLKVLSSLNLNKNSFVFWPHSALSRPLLSDWLANSGIRYQAAIFYDTLLNIPEIMPEISEYDEIIFTSSSTVDAFCTLFGRPPVNKVLTCIGPVTQKRLDYLIEKKI